MREFGIEEEKEEEEEEEMCVCVCVGDGGVQEVSVQDPLLDTVDGMQEEERR